MKIFKQLFLCGAIALLYFPLSANAQQICLQSDPDGAEVYLNGQQFAASTPAMIPVKTRLAGKPLMFQCKKEGFASKTITVTFTKKELKSNPVLRFNLEREVGDNANRKIREDKARVSRDNAGRTDLERTIIRWAFESDPAGARIFWRVISSVPDAVKNTNETYLTTTPFEETRSFNILGLTYDN